MGDEERHLHQREHHSLSPSLPLSAAVRQEIKNPDGQKKEKKTSPKFHLCGGKRPGHAARGCGTWPQIILESLKTFNSHF